MTKETCVERQVQQVSMLPDVSGEGRKMLKVKQTEPVTFESEIEEMLLERGADAEQWQRTMSTARELVRLFKPEEEEVKKRKPRRRRRLTTPPTKRVQRVPRKRKQNRSWFEQLCASSLLISGVCRVFVFHDQPPPM